MNHSFSKGDGGRKGGMLHPIDKTAFIIPDGRSGYLRVIDKMLAGLHDRVLAYMDDIQVSVVFRRVIDKMLAGLHDRVLAYMNGILIPSEAIEGGVWRIWVP